MSVSDVVVIGSGASGGMAAFNLAQKGVKVLLLDAGEEFDRRFFWTHTLPYQADAQLDLSRWSYANYGQAVAG